VANSLQKKTAISEEKNIAELT